MTRSKVVRSQWRKSSYSGTGGAECVEVAASVSVVGVRDSKAPEGPALLLGAGEWSGLVERIKGGAFDLVH